MKTNKLARDAFTGERVIVQYGRFLELEGRLVIALCECGCFGDQK